MKRQHALLDAGSAGVSAELDRIVQHALSAYAYAVHALIPVHLPGLATRSPAGREPVDEDEAAAHAAVLRPALLARGRPPLTLQFKVLMLHKPRVSERNHGIRQDNEKCI